MGSKPVAEVGYKGWIDGQILNGFGRANSAPNEVTMEELHSEVSVIANFSTLKMRASATSKMAAKGIKYVEIDVAQNNRLSAEGSSRDGRRLECIGPRWLARIRRVRDHLRTHRYVVH